MEALLTFFLVNTVLHTVVGGKAVRVTGISKGAGMIRPNMATMLCVIMSDAELTPVDLDAALRESVHHSFNCISVEGHTSTSDTVGIAMSPSVTFAK